MIRRCRDDELAAIGAIVNAAAVVYRGVIPEDRWHEPYMADGGAGGRGRRGRGVLGLRGRRGADRGHGHPAGAGRHADPARLRGACGAGAGCRRRIAGGVGGARFRAAARRDVGGRDVGDPVLRAARLRRGRRSRRAAAALLVDPGAPDRDLGGAGEAAAAEAERGLGTGAAPARPGSARRPRAAAPTARAGARRRAGPAAPRGPRSRCGGARCGSAPRRPGRRGSGRAGRRGGRRG